MEQLETYAKYISRQQLLEDLEAFDVPERDITNRLGITASTLVNYRRYSTPDAERLSKPNACLLALNWTLLTIAKKGHRHPYDVFKRLRIDNNPAIDFIREHAKEKLLLFTLKQQIDMDIKPVATQHPLDEYRALYKYLNSETLVEATDAHPEVLIELVEDKSLRPSTRGNVLEALAIGARDEYLPFIREKVSSIAPHIRESAYKALFEYYETDEQHYKDLRQLFIDGSNTDSAEGVRKTIHTLLEAM